MVDATPKARTEVRDRNFDPRLPQRRRKALIVRGLFFMATVFGLLVLMVLMIDVVAKGFSWLDWGFVSNFPSRNPEEAGIKSAIVGSLWMMGLTALFAVPVSVGAAVYLTEYANRGWFYNLIQLNIANLAGVPSVLYGILGLGLFVRFMALERSILAGALTMTLLIMPILIISAQEALKAVPQGIRESAYALGATRSQVIWSHLLPIAAPGIMTGIILSLSRAVGETAPLIMIGALTFIAFLPESVMDPFTVLPIQIFNWTSRPQADFQEIAAAAIVILMIFLFLMNLSAISLRNHFERNRPY
ncbi:MAG: phosphate ABC transporter, permease protein PstA [Bacteroidetes bacterium CG12_big_fil_rev_8_21_14_0_65_60_17]|nr:MAG: phosphate ABC transporter, permease protein PstA [Bacteroidetes bacterium CG12_big_fil_rev_8_21_14_0_65_60_17]